MMTKIDLHCHGIVSLVLQAYHLIHGYLKQDDVLLFTYHKDVYFVIENYLNFCNVGFHSNAMYKKIEELWKNHHIDKFLDEHQCYCLFRYYNIIQNLLELRKVIEETSFAPNDIDDRFEPKYKLFGKGDLWLHMYYTPLLKLDEMDTIGHCVSQSRGYIQRFSLA